MGVVLTKAGARKFFAEVVHKCADIPLKRFYEANYMNQQLNNYSFAEYHKVVTYKVFPQIISIDRIYENGFDHKTLRDHHAFYNFVTQLKDGNEPQIAQAHFEAFLKFLGYTSNNHPFAVKAESNKYKISQKTDLFVNKKWEVYFTGYSSITSYQTLVAYPNAISKCVLYSYPFGEAKLIHYNPELCKEITYHGSYEISKNEKEVNFVLELAEHKNNIVEINLQLEGRNSIEIAVGSVQGIDVNQLPQCCIFRKLNHKANVTKLAKFYSEEVPSEFPSEFLADITAVLDTKPKIKIPSQNINSWLELSRFSKTILPYLGFYLLGTEKSYAKVNQTCNHNIDDHKSKFLTTKKDTFAIPVFHPEIFETSNAIVKVRARNSIKNGANIQLIGQQYQNPVKQIETPKASIQKTPGISFNILELFGTRPKNKKHITPVRTVRVFSPYISVFDKALKESSIKEESKVEPIELEEPSFFIPYKNNVQYLYKKSSIVPVMPKRNSKYLLNSASNPSKWFLAMASVPETTL